MRDDGLRLDGRGHDGDVRGHFDGGGLIATRLRVGRDATRGHDDDEDRDMHGDDETKDDGKLHVGDSFCEMA